MCSDPAELCVSSQQHIKVLLHALAQLSVDFVVAPRPPRGSARAESYPAACTHLWARAVVGRLRAARDKKTNNNNGEEQSGDEGTLGSGGSGHGGPHSRTGQIDRGEKERRWRRRRRKRKQWPQRLQAAHHMRPGRTHTTRTQTHTRARTQTTPPL